MTEKLFWSLLIVSPFITVPSLPDSWVAAPPSSPSGQLSLHLLTHACVSLCDEMDKDTHKPGHPTDVFCGLPFLLPCTDVDLP